MPIYQYCKEMFVFFFPVVNINLTVNRLILILYQLVKETLTLSLEFQKAGILLLQCQAHKGSPHLVCGLNC